MAQDSKPVVLIEHMFSGWSLLIPYYVINEIFWKSNLSDKLVMLIKERSLKYEYLSSLAVLCVLCDSVAGIWWDDDSEYKTWW